ncbi:MAG: polysaccharide biosynthesis tyrosine autokinase [candidate division NC10 bacterium]|nr:polysaccharide biosynthesis tyrosine autokinase [candidate division NC10 bacterium]
MTQYDLNLRDYWRIIRKRKWTVVLITVAFGAMAFAYAEVQQPDPIYQSTAVVKFERSTNLVGLLVQSLSFGTGDSTATQAAVIRSFTVIERAAKILRLIPPDLDSEAVRQNPNYIQRLSDIRGRIDAKPEENTSLINISVTSPVPAEATRVANAVAQGYHEENVTVRSQQIREARRFIEEQLAENTARIQQAEDGLRSLKERRGIVSLSEETAASLTRVNALEAELEKARAAREETASQLRSLQEAQAYGEGLPPQLLAGGSDPMYAKLSTALVDLTIERENLLVTLTPRHPHVQDIEARIATMRKNLENHVAATRAALTRELRAKERVMQAREAELQQTIQQIRQQQRNIPDVSRQYAQFQRELTLNENLYANLRTKLQEVQIREKEQADEVSIVRPATIPTAPINPPGTTGKTVVGFLIGLTVGFVLAFVFESLDTSIGTIQDVESYLETPVLGLIPNIDPKDPYIAPTPGEEDEALDRLRPFLITLLSPRSTVAESYRSLRTNVEFLSLEKKAKAICVTSASLMEGKTTTAINLATTVAQMGKRTLLVEADLRKPFLHHAFGIPREPGLTEVIVGNGDWRACLRSATDLMLGPLGVDRVMAAPNLDKLFMLTSGTPPPNPTEFLNSQRMTELIAGFRQEFDFVIFDCPPILPVTDAAILASKTDGTLIVYRVGKIARSALKRAKTLLENVRGTVLGIVLTGLKAEISPDYEELEYYRYAYGHEPRRMSGRASRNAAKASSLVKRLFGLS